MKFHPFNLLAIILCLVAAAPKNAASILNSSKNWLAAPEAVFKLELRNANLIPRADPEEKPYRDPKETTLAADLQDLSAALETSGHTNSAAIIEQYKQARETISARESSDNPDSIDQPERPDPILALERLRALDLPAEFLLYLKGATHWRMNNKSAAVHCWNELLALPESDRHYRSSWAAYMLARSQISSNPTQAHINLDLLRRLAAAGFADTLDLSKDSLGWEAAACLHEGDYAKAFELYLGQNDLESLRITAARAVDQASDAKLQELAADETSRKVITMWLISGGVQFVASEPSDQSSAEGESPSADQTSSEAEAESGFSVRFHRWSAAIESVDVADAWCAERLALAAYQSRDFEAAQYWIENASGSLTAQWLQAKLHLRENEIEPAAAILRRIASQFPADNSSDLVSALQLQNEFGRHIFANKRVHAELGVVELHLQNFVAALDHFIVGESWPDAAFVAERVLKLEELNAYVDSHSPATGGDSNPFTRVTHLLGRRLMRDNKIREARSYLPVALRAAHDQFTESLKTGLNTDQPYDTRAQKLFQAAKITREQGLELFGTELEPDWAIHDGAYESGLTSQIRLDTPVTSLPPSEAEIERIKASAMPFSKRFHYRYIAAELAWMSSLLMPNNNDQTAHLLLEAGSWTKNYDATYADRFYKSLVCRNRATELGQQADKLRWFPILETITPPETTHPPDLTNIPVE